LIRVRVFGGFVLLFFCTRTPLFLGLGEVTERDWVGGVTYKVFITPRFDHPVWGFGQRGKKKIIAEW